MSENSSNAVYRSEPQTSKSGEACITELSPFIRHYNLVEVCDFLKPFLPFRANEFFSSQIIRYFISCFKSYHRRISSVEELNRPENILPFNADQVVNEMKLCYDQVSSKV